MLPVSDTSSRGSGKRTVEYSPVLHVETELGLLEHPDPRHDHTRPHVARRADLLERVEQVLALVKADEDRVLCVLAVLHASCPAPLAVQTQLSVVLAPTPARTASTILTYPVHLQRLPETASAISSRVGRGFTARSAVRRHDHPGRAEPALHGAGHRRTRAGCGRARRRSRAPRSWSPPGPRTARRKRDTS